MGVSISPRISWSLFLAAALVLAARAARSAPQQTNAPSGAERLRGYSEARSRAELELEKNFAAIPSPQRAREWHRTFTAQPHPAGSPRNNELAQFIAGEWRKQGWEDVIVRQYDVWHSGPKSASLEMTAPVHYKAGLREDAYKADPD